MPPVPPPEQAAPYGLPTFVRFADLKNAGIINNWQTLARLIADQNFPTGILLGARTRAWRLDAIQAWLKQRPTEKRPPPARQRRAAEARP